MLEPSSSEEDSEIEDVPPAALTVPKVQNGGPPHVVDGGRSPGAKPDIRSGSPSPSMTSEKTLTGPELEVLFLLSLD